MSNLWIDAVTDRSKKDINRILELLAKVNFEAFSSEEKEEWLNGEKGALNRSDLERVKNNIELLSEVLELTTTIPLVPELPDIQFYDAVLNDLTAIRTTGPIKATTPEVPEQPLNTFEKWNDIEKILFDSYDLLLNNFHYYCGGDQIYAGDATGLLL